MVDRRLQNVALAIIAVFPVLSTITVALRIYSRKYLTKHLGVDDYLILAAWVLVIAETVTSWMYIKTNYVGIHYVDVPVDYDSILASKWNYANQILYNPILSLVKLSVILFLLRLNSQQKAIRIFAISIFVVTIVSMVVILIVDVFQCSPVAYVYDTTLDGHCINQGAFFVSTACVTLFTDVLVLILPTWLTLGLQMRWKQKVTVIALLSLGLIVTAVGIYRVYLLVSVYFPTSVNKDPTYNIGFCTSAVETNLAILTACGPALKPLVSRYLPMIFGSSYASGGRSGGPDYYGRGTSSNRYGHGTRITTTGNKSMAFELGNVGKKRKTNTDSGDDDSEKGIMTYNGIMRSIDVSVSYVPQDGSTTPGTGHDTVYNIQEPTHNESRSGDKVSPGRKMSAERIV